MEKIRIREFTHFENRTNSVDEFHISHFTQQHKFNSLLHTSYDDTPFFVRFKTMSTDSTENCELFSNKNIQNQLREIVCCYCGSQSVKGLMKIAVSMREWRVESVEWMFPNLQKWVFVYEDRVGSVDVAAMHRKDLFSRFSVAVVCHASSPPTNHIHRSLMIKWIFVLFKFAFKCLPPTLYVITHTSE